MDILEILEIFFSTLFCKFRAVSLNPCVASVWKKVFGNLIFLVDKSSALCYLVSVRPGSEQTERPRATIQKRSIKYEQECL